MTGEVVNYSGPGPGEKGADATDRSPPLSPSSFPFQTFVRYDQLACVLSAAASGRGLSSPDRKSGGVGVRRKNNSKTVEEIQAIVEARKLRELKNCLRSNHWMPNDGVRCRLWQILCSYHAKDKATMDLFYWDTVKQIYGTEELPAESGHLPTFVDPAFQMTYYLNDTGIRIARRVLTIVSYSCPDITYAPSLYPITCILLHYMTEEECYTCLTWIVSSTRTKFITQTKLHYETIWRTAMIICRKHAKSAVSYLAKQSGDNTVIESIHQQWLSCVFKELPFHHLIRIMDCFLCEGRKVMYRIWMAVLILFQRNSSASSANRSSVSKETGSLGMETALMKFCREMPCSPERLLKTAYGIRNFRSVEMDRLFLKTEMYLKSKTTSAISSMPPKNTLGPRSRSSDLLPTSQSQINIQMISHTLTIREGSSSPDPRPRTLGLYPLHGVRSVTATYESLLTLWSWLPVRITMYQPELLYTTEEHGCSMTTFFARVEKHEPTILIVKTTNGDVFGAYCSSPWSERRSKDSHGGRQGYFGTGETFVFTLLPETKKYPWVGINAASSPDGPACVRHAAELFMASDGHMITIGGGKGQAIWIDENIRDGKTEASLTFNNPPLSSSIDFEIRVVEVYGFAGTFTD